MPLDYHRLNDAQRQTCPLCGGPNGCVPSACGNLEAPCWCTTVTFNPVSLARVPEELRNVVCLCRRCAEIPPGDRQI
ncbi:cysteine-rich CWC family protein [Geothrix fermentans]|uniref:cysteine-rich CWC family protein n=1 Tax=Geothrix fermentans TaxID=44676 RepID=UPI000403F6AB|nr:cysteine-rich CWC family protein [Geothrix fermentans]